MLFLIVCLLAPIVCYGYYLEYEDRMLAEVLLVLAEEREQGAHKLVEWCMNGLPVVTKSGAGQAIGTIVCQSAKEVPL